MAYFTKTRENTNYRIKIFFIFVYTLPYMLLCVIVGLMVTVIYAPILAHRRQSGTVFFLELTHGAIAPNNADSPVWWRVAMTWALFGLMILHTLII